MNTKTKDYLKCIWANKATLAGYLSLPISLTLSAIAEHEGSKNLFGISQYAAFAGIFLLTSTDFGTHTLKVYNKTREYIKEHGKIKKNQQYNKYYCSRVAMRLAAKEAGLENTLEEENE